MKSGDQATASDRIVTPLVLVVDDDAHVREALEAELAPRLGPWFRVEAAASADEALALAAASDEGAPIAAVVADEKMPGKSGTELLTALRAAPAHRHGGRILLTGYAGLESAKRAINEAEVERYYAKPWDTAGQLMPALAEILGSFLAARGLTQYWLAQAGALADAETRRAVVELRRATWEYVTLLGLPAEELGIDEPAFLVDGDEAATHVVVWGCSGGARVPVAAARLVVHGAGEADWQLEAQTFSPGGRTEAVEALLVRAAQAAAWAGGATRLATSAPGHAVALYASLGFVATRTDATLEGAAEMTCDREVSAGPAGDPHAAAARTRWAAEQRACACAQTECLRRDYAAGRRGYWCPLDAAEGRGPAWLPRA